MDIAEKCYFLTKSFPKEELYGMVQQVRRSSASIAANIAEGYGRRSPGDYARFLKMISSLIKKLNSSKLLPFAFCLLPIFQLLV